MMKNIILLSLITINMLYAEKTVEEKLKLLEQKLLARDVQHKSKIFYLPLKVNKTLQDDVLVKIDNQENIQINESTMKYIASLLKDKYKESFNYSQLNSEKFAPLSSLEQFGIVTQYDNKNILINTSIPATVRKPSTLNFNRARKRDINGSITPEEYSGGMNFYVNKRYTQNSSQVNRLNISSDMTLNMQDYVLEGRAYYYDEEKEFSRGRVRLLKDDIDKHLRYTVGDIILPHHNRMSYQDTLGVGVEKFFNIDRNYQQNISRINSHEFFLQNNSRVEIYINNQYRRTLNLVAGTHNLYNLNLPSGVNSVQLKVIEDGGKVEYINFDDFSYSEILKKGISRYGGGVGIKATLDEHTWDYDKKTPIASAYIEYGLLDNLTVKSGLQTSDDHANEGLEFLWGTNIGLVNPYLFLSQVKDDNSGYKVGLEYRTNIDTAMINLAYENSDDYATISSNKKNSTLYRGGIYSQLGWGVNMGVSASSYTNNDNREDKYGLRLSKSIKGWNTQINFEHIDKEGMGKEEQIYLSLDYRFGQENIRYSNYVKEKRHLLNLNHSPIGQYGVTTDFQYENTKLSDTYNLRADLRDEKFILNTSYNNIDNKKEFYDIQLATGFVFAGDQATITAPINSSFIIVENDENIENSLGLIGYQDSENLIYDKFAVNIGDYSLRELTVNESNLDFGIDLENEKQNFLTNYKSGSIMKIKAKNILSVKGKFYNKETKKPLAFKAFKIFNSSTGERSTSFTNENGEFTMNEINIGHYNVSFMREKNYDGNAKYSFDIESIDKENLMNLGDIYIKMPNKIETKKYFIYGKENNSTK